MVRSGVEGIRGVEAALKALANRRRLVMLAMLRRRREMHVGALADAMRLPMKT
jgi:DNA-binding transcriptional ArsR family regulator